MMQDLTVACFLTDKELQQRRSLYFDQMAASLVEAAELPTGYMYSFRLESDTLERLGKIIDLERVCCRFITFNLSPNAGE